MNGAVSVVHIDRLALAFAPKPWAFAAERRAEIDEYFAELLPQQTGAVEWPGAAAARACRGGRRLSRRVIWKPTMRVSPPGVIGAGRPPACAIVSARRRSWRPMAHFCSASWARTRSTRDGFIFPAARPIRTILSAPRVDLEFKCAARTQGRDRARRRRIFRRAGMEHGARSAADRAYQSAAKVARMPRSCARASSIILRATSSRNSPTFASCAAHPILPPRCHALSPHSWNGASPCARLRP